MILLLGGTGEGRRLAEKLEQVGWPYLLTVTTSYGEQLARPGGINRVRVGPLEREDMLRLMEEEGVSRVVDATHPFAARASQNAWSAARQREVPYYRLERPPLPVVPHPRVYRVEGFLPAAREAARLGEVIFLATGVNHLDLFQQEALGRGKRLVARVLPLASSLEKCREAGLDPSQVVALQGGGSRELNLALLKEYRADVLVTKDSGRDGGTLEKIAAARELDLPVVIVNRPALGEAHRVFYSVEDIISFFGEKPPDLSE